MNIYAFPFPGDPIIRPETLDEMVDRMSAEALQWVHRTCAEISKEYQPREVAQPSGRLTADVLTMLANWQRSRDAMLQNYFSNNLRAFDDQSAQHRALMQQAACNSSMGGTMYILDRLNAFPRIA